MSSAYVTGNVTVLGTASINTLIVNQTQLSTGSNQLGDNVDDFQTLYGTVRIPTGSLSVTGSTNITGSLTVTGIIQNTIGSANLFTSNILGGSDITLHSVIPTSSNYFLRANVGSTVLNAPLLAGSLLFRLGNSTFGQFSPTTGNFILQNGGSYTDAGYRLDVKGSTRIQGTGTTSATIALTVQNANASGSLAVFDDGNVGIGGVTPSGRLHVYEQGLSSYKTYTTTNPGVIINSYQSQPNPYTKTTDIVAASDLTVPSEIRLFTRTSGSATIDERLRINSSGSIGIGTSNPAAQLDLVGQYKQTFVNGVMGLYYLSTANANQVRGVWDFFTNTSVTPDFFGRFGFKFEGGTADSFKQYQIHVADSTTPKMVVNGAGSVGIGTIAPSASLHISGSNNQTLLKVDSDSNSNILFILPL
jgi:hypothetical protein